MLQFITHYTPTISYLDSVRIALAGGCRWVQLRMKDATHEERREVALEAQRLCREAGATFIIDDDVQLVREIGADGAHLGKNDMAIDEARRFLETSTASKPSKLSQNTANTRRFIIGGTANTFEDIVAHSRNGADYIGCGPFRFTTTKEKLSPVIGLDGYREITRKMGEAGIDLPIVAIGGITLEDIPAIMATGVTGVALSGAVLRAAEPVEEMHLILKAIETSKTRSNDRTI